MRTKKLDDFIKEIARLDDTKRDYIVSASRVRLRNGDLTIDHSEESGRLLSEVFSEMNISLPPPSSVGDDVEDDAVVEQVSASDTFHEQLAEKVGIPFKYYERMRHNKPLLLDENVNQWLSGDKRKFLVRIQNDKARALLSDRYKPIDHLDVLTAFLYAVKKSGVEVVVEECELTEKRMYVRVVAPKVEVDAPILLKNYRAPNGGVGHGIISGLILTNSETGYGSFSIKPRMVVLACRNGMIVKKDGYRAVHIGGQLEEGIVDWSEETKRKSLDLAISQAKDAVATYLSRSYLESFVDGLTERSGLVLKNPSGTIQHVSKAFAFSKEETAEILNLFVQGGDTTAGGVVQALTYFAHEQPDGDRRFEIEESIDDVLSEIVRVERNW